MTRSLGWMHFLGAAALAGSATLWAAEAAPAPRVLVLRNGNVLEGNVRPAGAYYRVDTAGALLQVPAEQVEMTCGSLDEAYEARRRARAGSTADSHLELAQWCLRLDLLNHAERELADARALDARHPGLGPVESQLRQLRDLEAARGTARAGAAASAVRQATHESPAAAPSFSISTAAQVQFVRSIQPMLIHNCATAACHQPAGPQRLQLDRWALVGAGNATIVRQNLAAALTQVRRRDPAASPLAAYAGRRHGATAGAASRPLDGRQMKLLGAWLNLACGVAPAESETTSPKPAEGNGPSTPTSPAAPAEFAPRDAFDAEIFNRRSQPEPEAELDDTASEADDSSAPATEEAEPAAQ